MAGAECRQHEGVMTVLKAPDSAPGAWMPTAETDRCRMKVTEQKELAETVSPMSCLWFETTPNLVLCYRQMFRSLIDKIMRMTNHNG